MSDATALRPSMLHRFKVDFKLNTLCSFSCLDATATRVALGCVLVPVMKCHVGSWSSASHHFFRCCTERVKGKSMWSNAVYPSLDWYMGVSRPRFNPVWTATASVPAPPTCLWQRWRCAQMEHLSPSRRAETCRCLMSLPRHGRCTWLQAR